MTDAMPGTAVPVHLRAAGVSLVVDAVPPGLPRVLHWGRDLGDLTAESLVAFRDASTPASFSVDHTQALSVLPTGRECWPGTPGLVGQRPGPADGGSCRAPFPDLRSTGPVELLTTGPDGGGLRVSATDPEAGLALTVELSLDPFGVLRTVLSITNTGDDPYEVDALRVLLPLPPSAVEVLDLTGVWCHERSPQRSPLVHGTHLRANRRGRTGHDATLLLTAGSTGFGFRTGEVRSVHVAWSGNHEHLVERFPEGAGLDTAVIGGGEVLAPGEVVLAPGETYRTPEVFFVWSGDGLDGVSRRLHRHVRARAVHPRSARPLVLNTWEAVYFDHDLERLRTLADVAAAVGVERFVLDDGWFRHRRDDSAGLGDWYVDETVWPEGLHPLVDHVRGLGLQMGLWVEPEMVNPDSDLARAHPDWLLTPGAPLARSQQGLDLANPEAYGYVLDRLDALVGEYSLDYLKWDHNRDLHVPVHAGRPGLHAQTVAAYRLLDDLLARHPALEIESCSSGGARIDLGILARTHRIWASDTNDAVERQSIQRMTWLLLPPELVGSHIGPARAHTTGRTADLPFRAVTALFGHAGIEWDIAGCTEDELAVLACWIRLYKELRPLLHTGDVVRADLADPGALLHGVVSADGTEAVFGYARLAPTTDSYPGRVRLPGLDPARSYRIRPRYDAGRPELFGRAAPPWLREEGVVLPGTVLTEAGLPMPGLRPSSALLLHLTAACPVV